MDGHTRYNARAEHFLIPLQKAELKQTATEIIHTIPTLLLLTPKIMVDPSKVVGQ
jgi:hypothetical protein